MSKTVLANVDGFTPVMDVIVQDMGLMSAVVFGRVWRYCQMDDKVCKASLESIGESIDVDRATVMRHIKELCEAGYLKDLTPDLRNRPHVYVDTGKAELKVSIYGVAQSNTYQTGVSESHTTVAESNSTVAQRNSGVAESHLNRVFKKEVKKEEEREEVVNPLFSLYENNIGPLTTKFADGIELAEKTYGFDWTADAILLGGKNTAKSWNYCAAVLERWKREGRAEKKVDPKQRAAVNRNKYVENEYADFIEH